MDNLNPEENRLYATAEDLHPLAWQELESRNAEDAAAAAGAEWNGECFRLRLAGRPLEVFPGTRRVRMPKRPAAPVGYQRALIAVNYLAKALEADPGGDWVTFRELPGGDGFFRGPHSLATPELERCFGSRPELLESAARELGGNACEGGDASVEVSALPRIPVRVVLWSGTDEFAPAANLLTDRRAHLHLPLDVLWALTNVLITDLCRTTE